MPNHMYETQEIQCHMLGSNKWVKCTNPKCTNPKRIVYMRFEKYEPPVFIEDENA